MFAPDAARAVLPLNIQLVAVAVDQLGHEIVCRGAAVMETGGQDIVE